MSDRKSGGLLPLGKPGTGKTLDLNVLQARAARLEEMRALVAQLIAQEYGPEHSCRDLIEKFEERMLAVELEVAPNTARELLAFALSLILEHVGEMDE